MQKSIKIKKILDVTSRFFAILVMCLFLSTPFYWLAEAQSEVDIDNVMTRGEAIQIIADYLRLEHQYSNFLIDCYAEIDFCLMQFSGMSRFEGLSTEPLILYPDVPNTHKNYYAINVATLLGFVRGYINEENSPFHPDKAISKAEALKMALVASNKLAWKEYFEFASETEEIQSELRLVASTSSFLFKNEFLWQARYMLFALQNDLISNSENISPNAPVSRNEFLQILQKLI